MKRRSATISRAITSSGWISSRRASEEIEHLRDLFGFHPLALEDTLHFGQRPKLDHYGDYVFLVFYGARDDAAEHLRLQEVQMFVSGKYLVTVHQDPLPALDEQQSRLNGQVLHSEQFLLYRVFDALTDSFFPPLAQMDEDIDELEDAIVAGPTDAQLQRLFAMKRTLVSMRKVVTPQRDLFARSIDQLADLPGLELDERDYFRDVYDHLIRISDLIDSYRDLLSGSTDLYLSTVSNRQNEVMKQLADRRHDLPAAVVHHRLLRHELQMAGDHGYLADLDVLRFRPRQRAGYLRWALAPVQTSRLDVERAAQASAAATAIAL